MRAHKSLLNLLLPSLVILLPLVFLPLFFNAHNSPKIILIVLSLILLSLSSALITLQTKKFRFTTSPLHLPLLLVIGTTIISLLATSEGRPESLLGKGILLLILTFLSLFILNTPASAKLGHSVILSFIFSSSLLAILSLLQLLIFSRLPSLPSFLNTQSFSPAGNAHIAASILFVGLLVSTTLALVSQKTKLFAIVAAGLNLVGFAAYLSLMLPGGTLSPNLLPFLASWSIMLDSYKSLGNILFGVGFSNFPTIFAATKPLYLNNTSLWQTLPDTATNEFFNLAITGGILLLSSFIIFTLTTLRFIPKLTTDLLPLGAGFIATAILLLLTPGSIPIYTLFFIFAALIVNKQAEPKELHLPSKLLTSFAIFAILAPAIALGYLSIKAVISDYFLRQAQIALQNSDAKGVYQNTLRAVQLEPKISSYRISYSQVNLALAKSISNQKSTLSEEEKKQIAQLINQSIREAKAAVALRPSLSSNWQNLSNIYQNLIGVAETADQFAVNYLEKAVSLDPANPSLRVQYAGLLYQLSKLENKDKQAQNTILTLAATELQTAIRLKNNYSNAYYNLSKVYEALGDQQAAIAALESTLQYLKTDTPDYQTAKTELENLKQNLPNQTNPKSSNSAPQPINSELTAPSPLPSPLNQQIELPAETQQPPDNKPTLN